MPMTTNHSTRPTHYFTTNDPRHQVLATLLYFEIFSFPLTAEEIWRYSPQDCSISDIKLTLRALRAEGLVSQHQGFYSTQQKPEWVEQRLNNAERAQRYRKRARWAVALMRHFPFVRAVFISGSMSKGVITEDGDVDYFIVTKPGRLWITRTFLVLFKKIVLLNSHRYFCVNYFVDTDHLLIEEQNRFTATEIATILPMYNGELYQDFQQANWWKQAYYPQYPSRVDEAPVRFQQSWLQQFGEWLFGGKLGTSIDKWCMKISVYFWQKKFSDLKQERFAVALKSRRYVSKHHPQDFQRKVKQSFEAQMATFEERTELQLERTADLWKKQ